MERQEKEFSINCFNLQWPKHPWILVQPGAWNLFPIRVARHKYSVRMQSCIPKHTFKDQNLRKVLDSRWCSALGMHNIGNRLMSDLSDYFNLPFSRNKTEPS